MAEVNTMHLKKVKAGKRERISFSRLDEVQSLPYLLEIQKDTYQKFLDVGIKRVLEEFSPIVDYNNKAELEFLGCYFGEKSKYDEAECAIRKQTYSLPLYVKARLTLKDSEQVIEEDVYIADIPIMNESGSFTINGVKRVIVTQISRSSSAYFDTMIDKNGKNIYTAKIIPERGAWIELEQTSSDILKVIIDKQSKMSAGILLKSLGIGRTDEDLLKIFGDDELIKNTLDKEPQKNLEDVLLELAKKLRPSDVPSIEVASKYVNEMFFTQARYDLKQVGRFKINKKLSLAARINGTTVSRDVVSPDGETFAKKGDVIDFELANKIQNNGVNEVWVTVEGEKEHKIIGNARVDLEEYSGISYKEVGLNPKLKVYYPEINRLMSENKSREKLIKAIKANEENLISPTLTVDDIIAIIGYMCDLNLGFGTIDNIDHLGNSRLKPVGETVERYFRNGVIKLKQFILEKMQVMDYNSVTPKNLISARQINTELKEFMQTSELSQSMDDNNPLTTITVKRRVTRVGPGGINKERAGVEVRDIHYSQYGRICPIETPEGQNIGIVLSLASHARIDEFGFIVTPYRKVDKQKGIVTNEVVYLSADEEDGYAVASAMEPLDAEGHFINKWIACRRKEEVIELPSNQIDYVDVSPSQFLSVASCLVPFVENDDTPRALMACNMQKQAVPLIKTEAPMVATGLEKVIAKDSGAIVCAKNEGVVSYVSADTIKITLNNGAVDTYNLTKFERTSKKTCLNQNPIVKKGEKVKKGDVIADGFATNGGELALGKNVLIAFMNWEGYNFEDAILISERIVSEDVYTSIYMIEEQCQATITKLGDEEITRDIPNLSEDSLKNLDENGIIRVGSEVVAGDILVGKVTPKGETELSPEERLLRAIFGEKAREVRDTSLRVDHGHHGVVVDVKVLDRKNKDELDNGVNTLVKITIAQRRKLSVGDKMAGRHGNKGVVSRVLPVADMPFMSNGQPVDIVLNPLGVPSRMNIGQLLEVHLGLICKTLGWNIETPVFNGAHESIIQDLFRQNNLPENGRMQLFDGRTGEPFDNDVTVGYMYMMKLEHMVDSKVHARSIGPYQMITKQPLGGKAQNGGQRFGEMEVWALEAYGAANVLQEMLTVKSDDVTGRAKLLESIVSGTPIGEPGIPEGFKVLIKEMQALGLDVEVLTEEGRKVNITEINNLDAEVYPQIKDEEKLSEVEILDNEEVSELYNEAIEHDLSVDDLFDSSSLFDD